MAPPAMRARKGALSPAEGSWPVRRAPSRAAHRAPSEALRQGIFLRAGGPEASAQYRCAYGPAAPPPQQRKPAPAWIRPKAAGPRSSRSSPGQLFANRSVCGLTRQKRSEGSAWLRPYPPAVCPAAGVRSQYRASRTDWPHTSRKKSRDALSRCTFQTCRGCSLPRLGIEFDALGSISGLCKIPSLEAILFPIRQIRSRKTGLWESLKKAVALYPNLSDDETVGKDGTAI